MPLPDLEIDLLRSFVAVAETGSFTAAAEVVGRTQSAVSQKILRLEETLGCRVFDRNSRGLSLTRDGERLLTAARQMLAFNDETVRQFIEPSVVGRLRLGIADDFIPHQLPRLLARFARSYPGIDLELTTGLSCDLLCGLEAEQLDLALAKRDGEMQRGRIIWREPMVWIAAADVEIDAGKPVPLVLLPAPCTYRSIALEALEHAGRSYSIACTASSLMGIQAAVAGSIGVTVLGRSFVQDGLRILNPRDQWPSLPMTEIVLLGEDRAQSQLAKPLVAFLTESLTTPKLQAIA
ncbi:LysR substrate-binding domain-containing protein [Dongia soli]|uniref:LysR substrate-binding domain-containing protein n=1 Tax=Dongia soli TaxID=600628 RepID=A0ABU5EFQ7_9PROT|nr:LysR substrate-binding domain-containing protein [Dongia soli]MDY0884940.1 LysR substrate-binding domain-containing protein [Dongia soli]